MKLLQYCCIVLLLFVGCSSEKNIEQHPPRIIFFGDSITELGDKPSGYVSIVRDSLKSLGMQYEVIGSGISGNKVTDLQQRLKRDVLSKHPAVVVIYIGINDVWHYQFTSRGLSGTPKGQFKNILTDIVEDIQSSGAQVILCTPSVIGEKIDGTNRWDALLDEYSDISRNVAREQQITLLDLRKEFLTYLSAHNPTNAEKDILTYDGVHLNERGNRFVAEKMFGMLEGLGLFFPKK